MHRTTRIQYITLAVALAADVVVLWLAASGHPWWGVALFAATHVPAMWVVWPWRGHPLY